MLSFISDFGFKLSNILIAERVLSLQLNKMTSLIILEHLRAEQN